MLACDFTVETAWLQRLHVLIFIEIASRKVHLASITANPTGEWVAQQARNLAWRLQEILKAQFLLREWSVMSRGALWANPGGDTLLEIVGSDDA